MNGQATAGVGRVVVTGAGSGIGHATARRLLGHGYDVWGTAISAAEAEQLACLGPRFYPHVVDVRDEDSVTRFHAAVHADLAGARLDGLLNVAGIVLTAPIADVDAATLGNILAVNSVGVLNTCRAFLPSLRARPGERHGGRIITVTSAAGRRTLPFTGAYSASKFATEALCNAMRLEFRPFGIQVVVVAPGQVQTPMAGQILDDLTHGSTHPEYDEPIQRMTERTRNSFDEGLTADQLSATLVKALQSRHPKPRYDRHSNYVRDVWLMRRAPVAIRDAIVARSLGFTKPS